ncbi:hypothetical protein [Streptomyces griseoviridis]|uniref:hypothetical protein n=1 Tax=Streptomyces griseoviridis TaxID=45398 RepID=UPI0027D7D889|nr:hypothetical protein [Streptomyces griseoviridis]
MTEALNGTFKAELIEMQRPWQDVDQVERANFQWITWYNKKPSGAVRSKPRSPPEPNKVGLHETRGNSHGPPGVFLACAHCHTFTDAKPTHRRRHPVAVLGRAQRRFPPGPHLPDTNRTSF